MRARRSRFSRGARTSSTRSASRTSYSAARCWSGTASTRRSSASGPRTRHSSRWSPLHTGQGRGWRWGIWRSVGGTLARQRVGTETLPRHWLSSASEKGGPREQSTADPGADESRALCGVARAVPPGLHVLRRGLSGPCGATVGRRASAAVYIEGVKRPPAAIVVALVGSILLAAGCGGGGGAGEGVTTSSATAGTLESLWRASGENVGAVAGTSDFAVGPNRVSFLVVDKQGRVSDRPTARVWVAHGLKQAPFAQTTARLEPIGVPGGETADAGAIYVANIDTPSPGTYWYLARPVGGPKIGALGNVVVKKQSAAPSVGDRAIPSRTPTLASTGGDLSALTTARHPDRALYRSSVAEALAAHAPFVLSFATPEFCQSRTCGPVVDVVSAVRRGEPARSPVRFIHVEIYKGNDPANGVNRWVDQWRLPTEPLTYVVDRNGVIRTKFEGAFSARELERAVDAVR